MTNERYKQTYYGAIELQSHELLVQPYKKGESSSTIAFLKYLQSQYPKSRIALIWDGASYHRSNEVKSYLHSVNQDLETQEWKVTCIRFAPNAPEQNQARRCLAQSKAFCT